MTNSAMITNEYTIYCDESEANGKFYSNFYGGAAVDSKLVPIIDKQLNAKKEQLYLKGEIKWSKVTENYLQKYIELINLFFDQIAENKIKIRIMFTQNRNVPSNLSKRHYDEQYFILYYQFLKGAFGLQYINDHPDIKTRIKLYLDQFPDERKERVFQFKNYLAGLSASAEFRRSRVFIEFNDIMSCNSHKHVILQCLDVVLGAMHFRLNDKHKEKPLGKSRRSSRTIAKEKLYDHIRSRIINIYPNFNIGVSTSFKDDERNIWLHPYRHWLFVAKDHVKDSGKTKKAQNKRAQNKIPTSAMSNPVD
jgi:hypothetical protein